MHVPQLCTKTKLHLFNLFHLSRLVKTNAISCTNITKTRFTWEKKYTVKLIPCTDRLVHLLSSIVITLIYHILQFLNSLQLTPKTQCKAIRNNLPSSYTKSRQTPHQLQEITSFTLFSISFA